jgi:hypothetical protein
MITLQWIIYYEIKKPPAARGRFLKKLPPGP